MSLGNVGENPVDGIISWKSAVVDDKVTLHSLWDIITTTSRLNHGSKVVHVNYVTENAYFY